MLQQQLELVPTKDDQYPPDLAKMTFFQIVNSNRGTSLVNLLSIEAQPSPTLWEHYEAWWLTAKVGSYSYFIS